MEIQQILEEIYSIVSEIMPKTANSLQAGLSRDTINEITKALPFVLPEEFYKLYEWRNGSNLFEDNFFPHYTFLSLERGVQVYFELKSQKYSRWKDDWFPFLEFNSKQWFFVKIKSDVVYKFYIDDLAIPTAFKNLNEMLSYYLDAYERGVFYVDEYGLHSKEDDN